MKLCAEGSRLEPVLLLACGAMLVFAHVVKFLCAAFCGVQFVQCQMWHPGREGMGVNSNNHGGVQPGVSSGGSGDLAAGPG